MAAGSNRSRAFMANALQIYGLLHFVHNLVADVHSACTYWSDYYKHLQVLSSILTVYERRRRYVVTCVKPSCYRRESSKFDHFDGHLYTKRWKEVTKFSKALLKVVWVMAATWDEQAYASGASAGAAAENDDSEFGELDPKSVTSTLKDSFFRRYLILVVAVDTIPETMIGQWGAACPCHEALRLHMSEHMYVKLVELHYGDGYSECPLSGCRASEICAGYIGDIVFFTRFCFRWYSIYTRLRSSRFRVLSSRVGLDVRTVASNMTTSSEYF